MQNCLVRNPAGLAHHCLSPESMRNSTATGHIHIHRLKEGLCARQTHDHGRSAQADIRFSLKMLELKCMLKCQYVLTHFAELFVQYCRRVISWLLISCSFCSY